MAHVSKLALALSPWFFLAGSREPRGSLGSTVSGLFVLLRCCGIVPPCGLALAMLILKPPRIGATGYGMLRLGCSMVSAIKK